MEEAASEEEEASEEPSGAKKGQLKPLQASIGPDHTHGGSQRHKRDRNYIKSCQLA